jgi:hypothetical protein
LFNPKHECSSRVESISPPQVLVKTASGSFYQLIGEGGKAAIQFKDFELVRHGFS